MERAITPQVRARRSISMSEVGLGAASSAARLSTSSPASRSATPPSIAAARPGFLVMPQDYGTTGRRGSFR